MGARAITLAVLAFGISSAAVAQNAASTQPAPAAQGDVARGEHLFMAVGCYQCHGTVGQGGVGPRLAPNPPPAEAIALYIRNPTNVMPPYVEKVLGDQDVRDIHAYLASIPPPPARKDVPLLNP